jgi:membrane fusion protein, heavy metal efflux system
MRYTHQQPRSTPFPAKGATIAAIALGMMLCACSGGDPKAKEKGATDSNKTQLFTVPKEQLSHIQVVTVQPTSWPRVLRLNGTVAYNSFLTTPVI